MNNEEIAQEKNEKWSLKDWNTPRGSYQIFTGKFKNEDYLQNGEPMVSKEEMNGLGSNLGLGDIPDEAYEFIKIAFHLWPCIVFKLNFEI